MNNGAWYDQWCMVCAMISGVLIGWICGCFFTCFGSPQPLIYCSFFEGVWNYEAQMFEFGDWFWSQL